MNTGFAESLPEVRPLSSVPADNLIKACKNFPEGLIDSGIAYRHHIQSRRGNRTDAVGKIDQWNQRPGDPDFGVRCFQMLQGGKTEEAVANPTGPNQEASQRPVWFTPERGPIWKIRSGLGSRPT